MKSIRSRAVLYGLVIALGLLSALPNLLPQHYVDRLPTWYGNTQIALGLDLRGGSQLLLEIDSDNLLRTENQQLADQLSDQLRQARVPHAVARVDESAVSFSPQQPQQMPELARGLRKFVKAISAGEALYSVTERSGQLVITPTPLNEQRLKQDALERSLEVVRRRLNETGLVEPSITRQGESSILVQLPGVDDPRHVRQLLGTTAQMSFHWVSDSSTRSMTLPGESGHNHYTLEPRVALEGKHIRDADLAYNPETGQPVVTFRLDKEGARRFGDMTQDNIGRRLAIVLDQKVITAPVIRGIIAGGSGEISGAFTTEEASDLALLLLAGALPAPLHVVEERTVGPDLGSDAIAMGLSTGLVGAALVFAFMVAVYGRWGGIACASLAVNIGLIFGVLSLFGATLTLPGIAGIILSIGMAVDANILINERIREETRRGKNAFSALDAGFKRAYSTILDSNVTSLIAISLLFLFGSGPVRGFAVAMAVGLVTSMFTAISVTRLIMEWRVRRLGRRPLQITGIKAIDRMSNRTIAFMRGRFLGIGLSALLSVGALFLFWQPGLNYGIDFSGGTLVEVRVPDTSVDKLRDILQPDFPEAHIQEVRQKMNEHEHYLIRLPMEGSAQIATGEQVANLKATITESVADSEFQRVELVGPKVSDDFTDATILAILIAGAGMLGYLWMRFEYHFALAATVTLALDLTKTIGFFALTGVEFNLTAVAALLALIGYSVNDKVVVFDRVRENLRLTPGKPMLELLNESITSTLTRTVFTSVTTFLALLPMGVAGGSAVASFALPMLFGIVVGTSSSVFIAAPIMLWLGQRRMKKGLTQLRPTAEQIKKELELIP